MGLTGTILSYVAAAAILVVPIWLAVVSDGKVKKFQAEVFGHWIRMAKRIRFMIWATFVYYVGVLIHGAMAGGLTALARFPWTASTFALTGRIMVATIVFALLFGIALAMQQVVRPSGSPRTDAEGKSGDVATD